MEDHLGKTTIVDKEFLELLTLLSKDVSIICLDEPELNLDQYELWTLVDILKDYDFDTDIWISTHEIMFADLVNAKFYMVDGVLRSIDRRKAIECIGAI